MGNTNDLVSKLSEEEKSLRNYALNCVSPDDAKYGKTSAKLSKYLSAVAEWEGCAYFQKVLLETRAEFGQADQRNVDEVAQALEKVDPLNMSLLEDQVTRHDQLAVIEEMGRFVSPETKALLHPGTTSYDILDSVRSYLFRNAWKEVMRPKIKNVINRLCDIGEDTIDILQVGRTHLQYTSPIPFGATMAIFARRIADRTVYLDRVFNSLRGKVSGIVGTGASIEQVIGEGRVKDFEIIALSKIDLEPDYAATQIVQKDNLADVGHGLVVIAYALGSFAEDMRKLYSSDIQEVTSMEHSQRLGGSSAAAGKNNPIDWENIAGTVPEVEGGMRILYAMLQTDFQRDLRSSREGRYQPQLMMVQVYDMFNRADKALKQLTVIEGNMERNLEKYAKFPDEAMVAILRGEGWIHPSYGEGHNFVKHIAREAKQNGLSLMDVALRDESFRTLYNSLPEKKRKILEGNMGYYVGFSKDRARGNIKFARQI